MNNNLEISVNGQKEIFGAGLTVSGLLSGKNINSDIVVVEVNLNIIARESYSSTLLANGDRVEILQFVGGG
jgi:sulfur carrier protein